MNASGLVLTAILIAVLIAVAFGAQQMDARRVQEIQQIMAQRDEAIRLAEEAKLQRDGAQGELLVLRAQMGDLRAAYEQQRKANEILTGERDEARRIADQLARENTAMKSASSPLAQGTTRIPVTSGESPRETNRLQIPFEDTSLPGLMIPGLGALFGLAVLGSGGYMLLHTHDTHVVKVRMTREQLRAYIQYQRQQGLIPAKLS